MASLIDSLICECSSWEDFDNLAKRYSDRKFKGDLFERLTQVYLLTSSIYASKLKNVWWCNNDELPNSIRQKLGLPIGDEGIDLICETIDGEFWSVQSKYKGDGKPPTRKELGTFVSLSFNTSKRISLGLVVHTSTKPISKASLLNNIVEIGLDKWLEISDEDWRRIRSYCRTNKLKAPKKREPRKHQKKAIRDAVIHYSKRSVTLGKLIMPCGTGKSLTAFWIAQALKPKTIIVSVPSLALIRQSLADWTAEYLAHGVKPNWIAICSDETVGKTGDADSTVASVYETGIPTTTDIESIKHFLKKRSSGPKIIFTTYQSAQRLCDAAKEANKQFDLLICDEAHKTVGSSSKSFSTLLFDENIKVKKRIFMTATERVYKQSSSGKDDVVSMDNPIIYGDVFHQLTFKEAIKQKIICDYKIITIAVTEKEAAALITDNPELCVTTGKDSFATDAHNLSVGLTLQKVFEKHGICHAVTFHSSIKRATFFTEQQQVLLGKKGISNHHISSKQSAGERASLLRNFSNDNKAIISNARCLTEGVDIPSIDCVVFADPKKSTVDIVQAAGRAMRQSKATGKECGYILLPLIIPEGDDLSDFAEETNFKDIARVITSLSTQDERIAEQMRARAERQSSVPSDIVQIETDVFDLVSINSDDLNEAINTRVWSSVGKSNWRPFEEARDFVASLNLENVKQWNDYCLFGLKQPDIPSNPQKIYSEWFSWGDWLGTDNVATKFFDFPDFGKALNQVHSLKLKSMSEYRKIIREDKIHLPINPHNIYRDDWIDSGHWLGTGFVATSKRKYRVFQDAKSFAQTLCLNSQADWFEYAKSGDKPDDIPYGPQNVYKISGWVSWADWLGTNNEIINYWDFETARAYVQKQGIKTRSEWELFCKDGKKPKQIPFDPYQTYKNQGWISFPDFFRGELSPKQKHLFLNYEEAKTIVSRLGLKSETEWRKYKASNPVPDGVPKTPENFYIDEWEGWPHFLGTQNISNKLKSMSFRTFEDARVFSHSLGLKNQKEWRSFAKTKNKPDDIPANPEKTYAGKGWIGFSDWLDVLPKGPGAVFVSFEEARKFARGLNINSSSEWREWLKSGKRPSNIPSKPFKTYEHNGWISWSDFLGRE